MATQTPSPTMELIQLIRDGEEAQVRVILKDRTALCAYSGTNPVEGQHHGKYGYLTQFKPSGFDLPFFEYRPTAEHDSYYCGCWGWD